MASSSEVEGLATPITDALDAAVEERADLRRGHPAVEAARTLALKLDLEYEYLEALRAHAVLRGQKPPAPDNVSMPTFLKYLDALGLLPSKGAAAPAPAPAAGAGARRLGVLTGGKAAR